jgi:Zn-dependent peptidase ImmA (M78 family)/transcriptional regulator with XRE-family HTH domain
MAGAAERVRNLIAASGLTHRAFAERIGLDTTKLSKSLTGGRRFTSLELARISELSEVTVDWLITGVEPELAVAARSSGGSSSPATQEAERLSALRSDMAFLGFAQPWKPPFGVDPYVERDAEQLAVAARDAVADSGRSTTETDLASVVEVAFGADVAICSLGAGFDGLAVSSDDVKLILVGTSRIPARQRFTIAHELGHLLAGDDQRVHVDSDIHGAPGLRDPSERRANAFAAAFLMPESKLRDAVEATPPTIESLAALAAQLSVSPASLAIRMRDLELIDSDLHERFRETTSAEAARIAGQGESFAAAVLAAGTSRPPGLLLRDTYRAYEAGEATLRPYANLIGTDVDELRVALETRDSEVSCRW